MVYSLLSILQKVMRVVNHGEIELIMRDLAVKTTMKLWKLLMARYM